MPSRSHSARDSSVDGASSNTISTSSTGASAMSSQKSSAARSARADLVGAVHQRRDLARQRPLRLALLGLRRRPPPARSIVVASRKVKNFR